MCNGHLCLRISLTIKWFPKRYSNEKKYLLQISYVVCTIVLLNLLWEFVEEELFSLDEDENIYEKLKDVLTAMGIGLLALAIWKKVVGLHNGELDVKSQLDVGTTFTIRLPKPTSAKESEIIKISN